MTLTRWSPVGTNRLPCAWLDAPTFWMLSFHHSGLDNDINLMKACWNELFALGLAQCANVMNVATILAAIINHLQTSLQEGTGGDCTNEYIFITIFTIIASRFLSKAPSSMGSVIYAANIFPGSISIDKNLSSSLSPLFHNLDWFEKTWLGKTIWWKGSSSLG